MRRFAVVVTLLLSGVSLAGCGKSPYGNPSHLSPADAGDQSADITALYRRLGRLVTGGALPFVGTVVFAAGPGDSVAAIVGLSLETRALAFQREGASFIARYRVALSLQPQAGGRTIELSREEVVRVETFQETQRTDESVLFQQALRLVPGAYHVAVNVRDMGSTYEGRAEQDFVAPAFRPGTTSAPILTYQATGRGTPADPLSLVLNSRGAMAYGADTLLAYVEGYGFTQPTTVPFEVRDEQQRVVFQDSLRFRGSRPVESQVLRVTPDNVTLGELKLVVGPPGDAQRSTSALVSFSAAWVATNFTEVLDVLQYFGHEDEIRNLRKAPQTERARLWRTFYKKTDPDTTTPENEALSEYFRRVSVVNRLFPDEGIPGWQTDRGEVYITLGSPGETAESAPGQQRRMVRWTYAHYRLTLYFEDEGGFGRLRLTPGSRSEFDRVASRVRKQAR